MTHFERVMHLEVEVSRHGIGGNRDSHIVQLEAFYDSVQAMVGQERSFRSSLFFYPVLVMLRLFKSFNAQPRLGIVTRTLSRSANDMAHFLLVFMTIFISFTVSGTVLFGQDLGDFATFPRAFHTCFRAMM